MYDWRVTKYNPKNRDKDGIYLKNEWIRYNDLGKNFEGKKLTFSEYFNIESKYIQAILVFMECLNIDSLKVTCLIYHARYKDQAIIDGKKIINNMNYDSEMIAFIVQSILRNKFGCKLEYDDKMYVHFGWDYYMFVGSAKACTSTIKKIEAMGLFVEKFRSPYFDEDEDDEDEE
jgi:hypothetical protein